MPWIVAGAAIIGGYMSNRASAKQASVARDEAGRYSGTAHQREVSDLRAAGLNPILSGTGGAGASTPSGMVASQPADYAGAASTALAAKKNKQEVKLLKTQNLTAEEQRMITVFQRQQQSINLETTRLDYEARLKAQPGYMDAARLHAGWEGDAVRRAELLERGMKPVYSAARAVLPWGGKGTKQSGKRPRN